MSASLPYLDAAWTGVSLLLWWGVCRALWRDTEAKPRAARIGAVLVPGFMLGTGVLLLLLR